MKDLATIIDTRLEFKGSYIGDRWEFGGQIHGQWQNHSPANVLWKMPELKYSFDHIERAVEEADAAKTVWKLKSMDQRIQIIRAFSKALEKRSSFLSKIIAIETGKPVDEALSEAKGLISKIELTIEHGLLLIKPSQFDYGTNSRGEVCWRPKGVLAVIGPFNFPVHLNHGHIIPALLSGNVCILKPSEKTPYSAQIYMEAWNEVGAPKGVLQMIQGEGSLAKKLIRHVKIDGVLATTGYEVGCLIQKELAESPRKIVALEMGGKNAALVWEGDLDKIADDLVRSCFLTTGQRCTALSRIYVNRQLIEPLLKKFHDRAKNLVIQQPFAQNPKPFMGPLIDQKSVDNFLRYAKIGEHEGQEAIMRPKQIEESAHHPDFLPKGYYVTPSINYISKWDSESPYQNHEIFAPDAFLCPIDDFDEGIAAVNSSRYGLSFSCFCKEEEKFDYAADRVNCGVVYWNGPTVGASGRLPFGGWGRSGNHRPAGLFAIYNANHVQARTK